jgi:condensin complex subunit 3
MVSVSNIWKINAPASDDLYVALRSSLLERSKDKEASVRVQAALGLAKLQSGEDDDDLEEGQESLEQVLLDMLRFDPAP